MSLRRAIPSALGGVLCLGLLVSSPHLWTHRNEYIRRLTGARPNIVLIVIDTLRADRMGCYGFPANTSPELDEMARGGVRFANVVAQCPWTRPSIGSMLTSLYPRTIGIYKEMNDSLNDRFVTLPEILQDNGYRTVGLTANPSINKVFNFHRGFDEYVESTVVFTFMKPGQGQVSLKKRNLPSATDLFDRALELIDAGGDQPHYIQLVVMEVHEYYQRGERSMIRAPFSLMFTGRSVAAYLQAVRQLSSDIGDFVEALRSRPGFEDTLVVLASDHGEGLLDHPDMPRSRGHGLYLYESQLLVPLILYPLASDLSAKTIEQPVRLLDLMPTVLDYAGLPVPDALQGKSLMPLIRSDVDRLPLPERFVTETERSDARKIAAYSPHWRYIENLEGTQGRHPGWVPSELQAAGGKENGSATCQLDAHPGVVDASRAFLRDWEQKFPRGKATVPKKSISQREIEQLKSLGYLR